MIKARIAQNEDGPAIQALVDPENKLNADWSEVHPFWLVAEKDDEMVACCQVVAAKPLARLEMVQVSDSVDPREGAFAMKKVVDAALKMCALQGCSVVMGVVRFDMPRVKRHWKKRGFRAVSQGNTMIRKVA